MPVSRAVQCQRLNGGSVQRSTDLTEAEQRLRVQLLEHHDNELWRKVVQLHERARSTDRCSARKKSFRSSWAIFYTQIPQGCVDAIWKKKIRFKKPVVGWWPTRFGSQIAGIGYIVSRTRMMITDSMALWLGIV